jgi:hypothetical protein
VTASPALTIDDKFIDGLACPICATPSLAVQHMDGFPDFVLCGQCGSAFVAEDTGERVMYGKIPPDYPETAAFALKQWVWLEAVARRAEAERPKPIPPAIESLPAFVEAPEAEGSSTERMDGERGPEPEWLGNRLRSTGWSAGVPIPTEPEAPPSPTPSVVLAPETELMPEWLRTPQGVSIEAPPAPPVPPEEPAPARPGPMESHAPAPTGAWQPGEPLAEQRTRVTLRGDRVRFPINVCAHCLRVPAPARLPVTGSLPRAPSLGGRRPANFRIPLCQSCRKRAAARSTEQSGGRLQAHLLAALVALGLVVVALALNLVSFEGTGLIAFAALAFIALLGYLFTALVLLSRTGKAPLPADARFVSTTLLVRGSPLGQETVFAWRQAGYADEFFQANKAAVVGEPAPTDEDADIV